MKTPSVVAALFAAGSMCAPTAVPRAASMAGPDRGAACSLLPQSTMRIRLVLEPDVPENLRPQVESIVATIWSNEGLAIEWLPYEPPGQPDPRTSFWLRVTSRLIGEQVPGADVTLGRVRFLGGKPHRDVVVSWTAIREWARSGGDRQFRSIFVGVSPDAPLVFGGVEALARRAVALAAAHEVGHFVLASTTHDPSGLMRRGLTLRAVAAVEHPDLSLSADSRRRLQDRLAQGAACSTAPLSTP